MGKPCFMGLFFIFAPKGAFGSYYSRMEQKELFSKVMNRLKAEKRLRQIRRRVFIFSAIFVLSCLAFVPAVIYAWREFESSGFGSYFSLIFFDFKTIASSWQEYILTLLESLPVFGLAAVLVVVFTILSSLRALAKNLFKIRMSLNNGY